MRLLAMDFKLFKELKEIKNINQENLFLNKNLKRKIY